jgi:hypothetical protein
MKIQEQDIYHGTALMQIVEHRSFKALNRASKEYGHYLINTDRQVFAKYTTKKGSPWQFTFQAKDVTTISHAVASGDKVFVCLVCGHVTICALNQAEIEQVIDLNSHTQQSVRVEVPKSGSCRVHGSNGALARTVPHNSFPDKVFS